MVVSILRSIGAVIAGLVVAFVVIVGIEVLSHGLRTDFALEVVNWYDLPSSTGL